MGINNSKDMGNLLAQCKIETNGWQSATENFNYKTPEVLFKTYTTNFPTTDLAKKYIEFGPVAIANRSLANRNGNGSETSGDGWRYRGRGFIHLTGRELYSKAGLALHPNNPEIYVQHPELISSNPNESAKVAVWYYLKHVGKGATAAQASSAVNPAGLKKADRIKVAKEIQKQFTQLDTKPKKFKS
jgi:putative chitinase